MEKEICNGKFISLYHDAISYGDTQVVLNSIKKNIPCTSLEGMYSEEDEWAGGRATIVHIPIKCVVGFGHDQYKNTVMLVPAPEIQIVISDSTGHKSEYDKTEEHQHDCIVIFIGCRCRPYRHRTWEEYTNRYHYGYKYKIEDLLTYDILPCLRAFANDFKDILDPINSDITQL